MKIWWRWARKTKKTRSKICKTSFWSRKTWSRRNKRSRLRRTPWNQSRRAFIRCRLLFKIRTFHSVLLLRCNMIQKQSLMIKTLLNISLRLKSTSGFLSQILLIRLISLMLLSRRSLWKNYMWKSLVIKRMTKNSTRRLEVLIRLIWREGKMSTLRGKEKSW